MPEICFITTCRGRLAHLQQSLPTFVAQAGTSCIVVDYDCPERTAAWIEKEYPRVTVVQATDRPRFELSKARNLGAQAAVAPWLCFVDADVQLSPHFAAVVSPLLQPGFYYHPEPRSVELWGNCICHRDDFTRVEGYDDVLQGWGAEDRDFYTRLELAGVQPRPFPGDLLRSIPHEASARVEHYDVKDQWLNCTANRIYCRAKLDLMQLKLGNLRRESRIELYNKVYRATLAAHESGQPLEISIPLYREPTRSCGPLEARLIYRLPHPRGDSPLDDRGPAANGKSKS
jgi:glycosyltransferase involved in cell wall biosynthesis